MADPEARASLAFNILKRAVFVRSAVIASGEYEEATGELVIGLRNGAVYRYFVVPPSVFDELTAAPSAGRYFIDHVRDHFTQERLHEKGE